MSVANGRREANAQCMSNFCSVALECYMEGFVHGPLEIPNLTPSTLLPWIRPDDIDSTTDSQVMLLS